MASNDAESGAGYQDEYWVGAYYLAALFAEAFKDQADRLQIIAETFVPIPG